MSPLPDRTHRILAAIVAAPLAWSSPAEVACRVGPGPAPFADELAVLASDGWVEVWAEGLATRHGVDAVTLTPLAAEALGVRIVEHGYDQVPRWAASDEPDPPAPPARGVFRDYRALALLADPRPGPLELAILAETPPAPRLKIGRRPEPRTRPREADRCEAARLTRRQRRKLRFGTQDTAIEF